MESSIVRVLHIANMNSDVGVARFLMNNYRFIDRNKVQFDFVVNKVSDANFIEEIKRLGGNVFIVPQSHRRPLKFCKCVAKIMKNNKYDIVHGHGKLASLLALIVAKRMSIKNRIVHSHSSFVETTAENIIVHLMRLLFPIYSTQYFACSELAGEYQFGKSVMKNEDVFIVKNAIDTSRFRFSEEMRAKTKEILAIGDKFVIGHVGQFIFPKNHEFLIDIFKEVYDRDKDAVLLLVGAGEDEDKVKSKVADLGLTDAVKFLGVRSDIPDLMQAMDVFVLPSRFEGLGIVLIEAQATGLKCFTSDKVVPEEAKITDLLEFIGLEESAKAWADEILKYKSGYVRKDATQQIIDAGFEIKSAAKWLEDFYLSKTK